MQNNTSRFLTLFIFFAAANLCLAYSTDITLSKKERHVKINEYLVIAKSELKTDTHVSMEAAREAKKLSLGFDEDKLLDANLCIAQAYQQKGSLDTALLLINDALAHSKVVQNDTLRAEAYHILGANYQYTGSRELAIENYHNALKINESLGLNMSAMKQLNNIGLLYREEEEYDLALEYLKKCLKISKEKGYKKYEVYSYGNIGYVLMKQEKWEEACERFEKTLEFSQHIDTSAFCTINYLIADVKLHQKKYSEAKEFAHKALDIANHTDYALGKIYSQRVLGDVYLCEKKYQKARIIIRETLDYLEKKSVNLYLEDVLNTLYDIEYETGNYKKALKIQQQLAARKDSLNKIKTKEKISNSEYKYQLLKNEQENQLLTISNDSSKKIAGLASTIACLLLSLVFLSYFAYRKSNNHNEILEKKIAERTKELENSNIDLAKSNEELERFAFIASHDLKTPLRDIVSFTGLLERELTSNDNEEIHEYLSFIKKGGIRLNSLINNTLEYSKLSHLGKENQIQTIDLNVIVDELQKSMSDYIEERNAEIIKLNNLPSIQANHSSIVLLFQNILENSIKYNISNAPITKIFTKEDQDFLSVFVKDNGIGIDKEYHDDIFIMFSRLHNQNEYEGTGLGLSICKKIVEQLKGEIHIQSKIGNGSVFEIRFPRTLISILPQML